MTTTNDDSPGCQQEKESLGNDTPSENNACRPVSPFDSGEGLPYAPEGWPNSGDKWGWKVGRRVVNAGYYQDRYLFLPRSLQKSSLTRKGFQSMAAVRRYLKTNFPNMDLGAFFALFSWKVPSNKLSTTKVKAPETKKEETKEIPARRKLKRKAKPYKQPTRKSFRSVVPPIEQDADAIIELCSMNEEVPIESTEDLNLKDTSDSESNKLLNCGKGSPENSFVSACNLVASKEGSDNQTTPEKSPNGIIAENFDDYLNSLEDILVLPHTETSLTDPVMPNTTVENEKTNCREKLSTLLAMDFPSLVSSDNLIELTTLALQLRKDPSLTVDQLIKLKLVEEMPLISEAFLEANGNIEQADKFFADLEAKKVKVTCFKKEYSELKDKVAEIQAEIDTSTIAIKEIDGQISQLQSIHGEMSSAVESKQKIKAELTSTQTMLANSIPTIVHEIQVGLSEIPKWETKKVESARRRAEILDRFVSLKGITF